MSKSTNTLVGLLAGTLIGGAIGLLFAPDSGVNTRRKIVEGANEAKDKLKESAQDLKGRVVEATTENKQSLDKQLEAVVSDASHKAEDVISTLEKKLSELKLKTKKYQKS